MAEIIRTGADESAEERELMKLLVKDLMEEKLQKRAQDIAKKKQRKLNADQKDKTGARRKQSACTHLKGQRSFGGKSKILLQSKDYNLSMHTFINHKIVITCMSCRMKWRPGDTKEFLIRNGKRTPNHTKWGWEEAYTTFQTESTNMPSESERVLTVRNAVPDEVEEAVE